jgi:methyltransferase (TIGR00027 family)
VKAGEPSGTALIVAAGIVLAARDSSLQAVVDPEIVRLTREMLACTRKGRRLLGWIDSPRRRILLRSLERVTIPGIIAHWTCRKHWLAKMWETARRDGFNTLLTLGSGLDARSLCVARREGECVATVDVDHPATLAVRRRAITGLVGSSHRLIEHDFSRAGLTAALQDALGQDSSVFVLAEGLLMYLDAARVDGLFAELARAPARRLRIAFTFMETRAGSAASFHPRSRLIDTWLRWRGEPFRSGLDPGSLAAWLDRSGFRLIEFSARPGRTGDRFGLLRGECAAVAERT